MRSPMRRLLLLRHAKSDRSAAPGAPDHDRPLNPRGQETAPRIGAYMSRHKMQPDQVLCSTAKRTRETLALVQAEFSAEPPCRYDERLYEATPERILEALAEVEPEAGTVLVVGHNPGLQALALLLIASGDLDARERLHEQFPTSGLVVIDFALPGWDKLHHHSGRLERFIVPSAITAEID
jgi:phosphohistidine phosphatase